MQDHEAKPDAPTDYATEDTERRIKTGPFIIAVLPERNTDVPVEIEVLDQPPDLVLESWDHVAEASLDVPSGRLEIHECTGGSIDILPLPAGPYRVRVYFGGLGTPDEKRLDGDDHYRVVLWPAPHAGGAALKQYTDPRTAP